MNKIILTIFICAFALNAFACGGSKDKEEEDKKRFVSVSAVQN